MSVVPISTGLLQGKCVVERAARRNRVLADTADAIHLPGDDESMPVNTGALVEVIRDVDRDVIAFFEVKCGARYFAIDGNGFCGFAGVVNGFIGDVQVDNRVAGKRTEWPEEEEEIKEFHE